MEKIFNQIEFLTHKKNNFSELKDISPDIPFSDGCINFLDNLSKEIIKNKNSRKYPDVVTFAFYCRKLNILSLKKKYYNDNEIRLGRGIVFHIAPSNVPVNFAYSLISGMLSGNINIVRLPSKNYEQINIICDAINCLMKIHVNFYSRIILLRYPSSSEATKIFSSLCDIRIIWGGDETVNLIRNNKIPSRSFDITFADRYSFSIINADKYIDEKSKNKIAEYFYYDTYLFDQNACTSPHLIVWIGSNKNITISKELFWNSLHEFLLERYHIEPVIAVDKLTSFYNQSIRLKNVKKTKMPDNLIWRIEISDLDKEIDKFRCNSGYFSEYHASSIDEVKEIINRKYQTISHYGLVEEDIKFFITKFKPNGIDRIVPIGKTTDFSLVWDGYDLINTLSRKIEIII